MELFFDIGLDKKSLAPAEKSSSLENLQIIEISILLLVCLAAVLPDLCIGAEQEEVNPLFLIEQDGNYGYIDKIGNIVINPQFKYVFIDPQLEYGGDFSEGLALVWLRNSNESGYIDKTGKFVIEPKFRSYVGNFSEGLAIASPDIGYVHKADNSSVNVDFIKLGFIDKNGKFAIEPRFNHMLSNKIFPIHSFSEGLAAVQIKGKESEKYFIWGYIDKTGQFVIEPQFDIVDDFSEGLASVQLNGRWGYINKTGRFVIEPQFEHASSFSEGLGEVTINGKSGYIDKTGRFVIEPQFEDASNFSDGLSAVEIGGKWGYIDKTGKIVIKTQFDYALGFHNGLAKVYIGDYKDNKWGYINKVEKFVWKSDALRKAEWLIIGGVILVLAILVLVVGLFIRKYRRSKK
ncbi:MAG: WG repeat-containing protein [Planctomycetota bacterium]